MSSDAQRNVCMQMKYQYLNLEFLCCKHSNIDT